MEKLTYGWIIEKAREVKPDLTTPELMYICNLEIAKDLQKLQPEALLETLADFKGLITTKDHVVDWFWEYLDMEDSHPLLNETDVREMVEGIIREHYNIPEPKKDYLALLTPELFEEPCIIELFRYLTVIKTERSLVDFAYEFDFDEDNSDTEALEMLGITHADQLNNFLDQIEDTEFLNYQNRIRYIPPFTTHSQINPTITQLTEDQGTIDYSTKKK